MTARLPDRVRGRFAIFDRLVFLNTCGFGAQADVVRAAYDGFFDSWERSGSPWDHWIDQVEMLRDRIARLIGAQVGEIAITSSVSAGVSSLLSGLAFDGERDTIVVSDFEFPAVGQIAHAHAARGARVVHVPAAADATIPLERFAAAIDERTQLVALTHVCYRNGSRLDVEAVARLAHERGATVLVDAYQALGAIPVDVGVLGADFLVGGLHKYLLGGSPGVAFLYCRADHPAYVVPTATGWFGAADVGAMDGSRYAPAPDARRFDMGTPAVPAVFSGIAGLDLMEEVGIADTEHHVRALNDQLVAGVTELGATLATPLDPARRGPLVAVRTADERAAVAALERDGVVVSARAGCIRVSSHCYNSADDIDAVLRSLRRIRPLLDVCDG